MFDSSELIRRFRPLVWAGGGGGGAGGPSFPESLELEHDEIERAAKQMAAR
jgi:hypothetical protein